MEIAGDDQGHRVDGGVGEKAPVVRGEPDPELPRDFLPPLAVPPANRRQDRPRDFPGGQVAGVSQAVVPQADETEPNRLHDSA